MKDYKINSHFLIKKLIFISFSLFLMSFTRPDKEYKIFHFPKNQIPRIDGEFSDWEIILESFSIVLDELMDTEYGNGTNLDPKDFDIKVKVGRVNDLNRLYFYLEAYDDYWDFDSKKCESFMNDTRMIWNTSYLCAFRLMPLSEEFTPKIEADWRFVELERNKGTIQFIDESICKINKWHWDFGNGTTSSEQNPKYTYSKPGE